MADKIEIVRTQGPKFSTVETPAVHLFGRYWIDDAAFAKSPVTPYVFDPVARHFTYPSNLDDWHWAHVVAALKRHPECH